MPTIPLQTTVPPTTSPISPLPSLLHTPGGLAIIEIQGDLKFSGALEASSGASSVDIGRVVFSNWDANSQSTSESGVEEGAWMKKVALYIGKNQKLVGEVKSLPKPLGVMRRCEDAQGGETYEIADVVRFKISFTGRPEFV